MEEWILNCFPNITVTKPLKPGSQKKVYLVTHALYGECVMKLISITNYERVKREVMIVTDNKILHVPKIYESGNIENDGKELFYIFEEYIDGSSLYDQLKKGKLTFEQSVNLLETLLEIAVKLEEIGVVHRDIKPDNILINKSGDFFLTDFGIARVLEMTSLTYTMTPVGPHTPGYGAPELFQYKKRDISIKADLFSIGVVVYEAAIGKHPFLDGSENSCEEIWYKTTTSIPIETVIQGDSQGAFLGLVTTLMKQQISKRPPSAKKAFAWLLSAKSSFLY